MEQTFELTIEERGNGFPDVFDCIEHEGECYRITGFLREGSIAPAHRPGGADTLRVAARRCDDPARVSDCIVREIALV